FFQPSRSIYRVRVMELVAQIKPQNEEGEVKAKAITVSDAEFLKELADFRTWSLLVPFQGPDIGGVDKEGTLEIPHEGKSQFHAHIDLRIAGLVERKIRVNRRGVFIRAGPEFPDLPGPIAQCASDKKLLEIGYLLGKRAEGHGDPRIKAKRKFAAASHS